MKQPELGKRLKEARIAKKLTQSEVVGTFITRNMLSQIESGKAMPSVETLQYLAEVLEIPVQSLLSTASSQPNQLLPGSREPLDLLTQMKSALNQKDYRTVLSLSETLPPELEDEGYALSALAACGLAEDRITNEPAEAVALARKAMELSTKGVYANELVHSRALLLFNRAALDTFHHHEL